MSFKKLNLHDGKRTDNPLVVSSFLMAKFKKTLQEKNLSVLSPHIQGVKVSANSITIITENPLINSELKLQSEQFLVDVAAASSLLSAPELRTKKISFR